MNRCLPLCFLLFASAIFLNGCSGGSATTAEQGKSYIQLTELQKCFADFAEANGRPPKTEAELAEVASKRGLDPSTYLISKSDGQPFVVHWNSKSEPTMTPMVMAYESVGNNGRRMVLTSMGVMELNEKELSDSEFPSGFSFPPKTD